MARILEDEIANDPLGRGYAAMTDQQLLDSLNAKNRSRNRTSMTGREVATEVVNSEYDALPDAKKQQLLELHRSEDLDPFGFAANIIKNVFGVGSTTVTNLVAARVENISRGVEIRWGEVKEKDLRMHTLSRKHPN